MVLINARAVFQSLIVSSNEPEAMILPSGL